MRNSAIGRYITHVVLYSVACAVFLLVMDYGFNGVLLEYLFRELPAPVFGWISGNRTVAVFLVYITGLIVLSVLWLFRLSRLLQMASEAISESEPRILGAQCPEELRDFRQSLQAVRLEMMENEQARQLAEQQKNDLIVYLAHDLKTPLTSVIGYLSLLEEAPDMPPEQRGKYVGIALDKAIRLEQLINEFFDITRLNLQAAQVNRARVNLTILLIQCLHEFYPMFEEKELRVVQDIQSELYISGDADKLARVFDNLFRNAVSYCYAGTEVFCSAARRDRSVVISVKNIGDDISPEKLERIFDKFYRVDSARRSATGGAGLGLAIAKQIVELHGGTITAACHDGETEFTVTLPV